MESETVKTESNVNDNKQFAVRNIWEVQGEYARVSIDNVTFNKIKGPDPVLKPRVEPDYDSQGRKLRIFDIDGVVLMSRYDYDADGSGRGKTAFIMKHSDALARVRTLAQDRAQRAHLPFSL